MKRLLDYDPINGVSCWFEQHEDDKVVITHSQEANLIEQALERNLRDRNDTEKTARGIKRDLWKYAHVPAGVQMEWLQKFGVDFWNPHHKREVFRLLNHPDYKYLKTTDKHHEIRGE